MKWLSVFLCRVVCRVIGHSWGTVLGMGATCSRCGFVDPPIDLTSLDWKSNAFKRTRITATLTDSERLH